MLRRDDRPAELVGFAQPGGRRLPLERRSAFGSSLKRTGDIRGWLRGLFSARFGLPEAIAFAVQFQDMNMMGQAIEQGAGQALIAEDARPFLEREVRCDDGRSMFVTLAEYLEEQFRAGLGERDVAKFVDDEQLDDGELRLKPEQAPFVARLHQLMHEPGRRIERHGESALTGGEAERQGDVRLSGSAVAQSDDVVAGDDKLASRQFQRERLIERGMAVKSNVSKLLTAGKRAARMRRSTMRRSRSMSSSSTRRKRKRT
jgi:hypothetical protein